ECRLAVCVSEDSKFQKPAELDSCRVATSFPNVTRQFFKQQSATVHLVNLSGSVEIMIALGVADAIVELIETGSTLAANRLRILSEINRYQTVLVQNPECRQTALADRVV